MARRRPRRVTCHSERVTVTSNLASLVNSMGKVHGLSMDKVRRYERILRRLRPRSFTGYFLRVCTYDKKYITNPSFRVGGKRCLTSILTIGGTTFKGSFRERRKSCRLPKFRLEGGFNCYPTRRRRRISRRRVESTLTRVKGFSPGSRLGYNTYKCGAYERGTVTVVRGGTRITVYVPCVQTGRRDCSGGIFGTVPKLLMAISCGLGVVRVGRTTSGLFGVPGGQHLVKGPMSRVVSSCDLTDVLTFRQGLVRSRVCLRSRGYCLSHMVAGSGRGGVVLYVVGGVAGRQGRGSRVRGTRVRTTHVTSGLMRRRLGVIRRVTKLLKRATTSAGITMRGLGGAVLLRDRRRGRGGWTS